MEWFETCRKRLLPMRVIVIYDSYKLNMACLIDDFDWHVDTAGDYVYDLTASEYIFATAKPVEKVDTSDEIEITYPVVGEGIGEPGGLG